VWWDCDRHSKRADQELTRVSASFQDEGYYQSGFDVSRRFGENKEFGVRVNGAYADGEHIIDGMNDRQASRGNCCGLHHG
jgi:iron complex outermembrane receptor protein